MMDSKNNKTVNEASITSIYGQEKAKQIMKWMDDFKQYECNFPTITPNIHEANGRPLLLLSCPVLFRREEGEYRLTIGVGFTQQFPERPPHCALLLNPGERIKADHPIVAPNGSIRLVQLEGIQQNTSSPSLCAILLAVMDAFENNFPLLIGPQGAPINSTGSSAQQSPAASPSAAQPPNNAAAPQAGANAETIQQARENILLGLRAKSDEYLTVRETSLKHLAHLQTSKAALSALEDSLAQKKKHLMDIQPDVANLHDMIGQWKSSSEVTDTNACIVPQDLLHEQAMDLLADVQTGDDTLEILDGCLGKGILSCDDYLKRVSATARKQFMSKYVLKKATGQIAAETNMKSLHRRFPELDEVVVRDVLQSMGYDVGQAAARLTQMTTGASD